MRKYILLLLFISYGALAGFGGHWESDNKSSSYIIDLVETGDHVSGKYCFITNNGNRIDCTEQSDNDNITGTIVNGKALISFDSTFGGKGTAILSIDGDKLIYHVEDKMPFIEANMSVPDRIIMSKKHPE